MWWLMLMWWLRSMVVVVWHFRPGATWRNVSDTSLPLSKSGLLLVLDLQWHKFCNYFKITVARLAQWWHSGIVVAQWHSWHSLAQLHCIGTVVAQAANTFRSRALSAVHPPPSG